MLEQTVAERETNAADQLSRAEGLASQSAGLRASFDARLSADHDLEGRFHRNHQKGAEALEHVMAEYVGRARRRERASEGSETPSSSSPTQPLQPPPPILPNHPRAHPPTPTPTRPPARLASRCRRSHRPRPLSVLLTLVFSSPRPCRANYPPHHTGHKAELTSTATPSP